MRLRQAALHSLFTFDSMLIESQSQHLMPSTVSMQNGKAYESRAWQGIGAGWKPIYGSFANQGFSVESHEFSTPETLDWGTSFHPDSVELCLNIAGRGEVQSGNEAARFESQTIGSYSRRQRPLEASRAARDQHRFLTVELSFPFLNRQLAGMESVLRPEVRDMVFGKKRNTVGGVERMETWHESLVSGLWNPPVAPEAYPLWYQSKLMELMASFFFPKPNPESELFCMRQKRVAHERVERVIELLRVDLENPPTLEALGQQVGCSPFYLSRIFSREIGMTIPQYIRKIRMERAAELLLSGKYNVTEAAMAVGYSSLSHFSKAFCETIGCCPALFPQAKHLIK